MTAPTAAMMYSPRATESHLLRKLVLLFLLVTALALGLLVLFRLKPNYPFIVQHTLATFSMAIVAAFGARFVLGQRHVLVRFIAALAAFVAGLYIMGAASQWKYGLGPFNAWPRAVDWDGIAQLGVGIYLILIVFRSWRPRPVQVTEFRRSVEPELRDLRPDPEPLPAPAVTPRKSRRVPRAAFHLGKQPASASAATVSPEVPSVRVRRSSHKRERGMVKTITAADLPVRPKARRSRSKARVQFAVVEEHRCPFCLQPVSRADPAGVVECDVCHALHHKDCWDITGVCQVPHLNS